MTTKAKTYDKKFNATRGAQRAGLKPGTFEVFKTPDGRFSWRAAASSTPTKSIAKPAAAKYRHSKGNATAESGGPKMGKRKAIIEQAQAGVLPIPPDFSKPTHARFRAKLAKLVALAEGGRCRGPEGGRDQSGLDKPESDGAVSRSGDHRHRGAAPLAR